MIPHTTHNFPSNDPKVHVFTLHKYNDVERISKMFQQWGKKINASGIVETPQICITDGVGARFVRIQSDLINRIKILLFDWHW